MLKNTSPPKKAPTPTMRYSTRPRDNDIQEEFERTNGKPYKRRKTAQGQEQEIIVVESDDEKTIATHVVNDQTAQNAAQEESPYESN